MPYRLVTTSSKHTCIFPYLPTAALMCAELQIPTNGNILYSTNMTSPYDFGTEATYVCDSGFGISGSDRMRTCGGMDLDPEGIWSGLAATCERELLCSLTLFSNEFFGYQSNILFLHFQYKLTSWFLKY